MFATRALFLLARKCSGSVTDIISLVYDDELCPLTLVLGFPACHSHATAATLRLMEVGWSGISLEFLLLPDFRGAADWRPTLKRVLTSF